ncbi:helicase-related protein [Rhodovibrionaceae bacterium A322]
MFTLMNMFHGDRISAVLGPTNTGKTFLAIERMLAHNSGMMGFPLRLLARENYDKVVRIKGAGQVALITGEEKIIPRSARYFLCTVESMPLDRPVSFLGIDEIQLAADPERGHIFTDRLLHSRGVEETMFLGSSTIQPLLKKLVPEAEIITRPRFSTLSYIGPKKVSRLPPRSAVVAFSANEVYATAEYLRRQRGGTAVVMGALSPRTRNAQVELFEAGEVDYLVATDAIGMGLNLDLNHVAFAKLSKFDGFSPRRLKVAEVAQIAGRAGRHMNDGTFGTTSDLGPMDEDMVEAVEDHAFEPLTSLFWRNRSLNFRSPGELLRSLDKAPDYPELVRVRPPEDYQALAALSQDQEILDQAKHKDGVRLLWDVCQVPDFRKTLSDQHSRLLKQLFLHLRNGNERLPNDWINKQISVLDRYDGDIDTLLSRISHTRTWTYISHRADWMNDSKTWQERTRGIEDRLSDALHERLTQRFIDRRTVTLVRRMKEGAPLMAAICDKGEVMVEGQHVGHLEGFRFLLDNSIDKEDSAAVHAASRKALASEIPSRLTQLEQDNDGAFRMDAQGCLYWREAEVATLAKGHSVLAPRLQPLDSDLLDGPGRERLRVRLDAWLGRHLKNRLSLLFALENAELSSSARGLAFQLLESLGCLSRRQVADQLRNLEKADRKALGELKIRIGSQSLFIPGLLKPVTVQLRALLWAVYHEQERRNLPDELPVSLPLGKSDDEAYCLAMGYRFFEHRGRKTAYRVDFLERLSLLALRLLKEKEAVGVKELAEKLEQEDALISDAMGALGFRRETVEGEQRFHQRRRRAHPAKDTAKAGQKPEAPGQAAAQTASPEAQADKAAGTEEQASDSNGAEAKVTGDAGTAPGSQQDGAQEAAPAEKKSGKAQRPRRPRKKGQDASGKRHQGQKRQGKQASRQTINEDSPFAVLKDMKFG